ncbi:GCN5 family acetyltransferase [Aeromicrobium sp. Root495]|uniref:GNAT family N-acetyltransferase n=1 Tax=Aeromicrobium sp. Root495 TaxID=1736550 RepID=UPI0007023981|nr:GNAT family N-acetyltransferase [Aeromicrobium sp. Root495]KQY59522.1 GCN5 family acetyltransferase [Aeromicrobium sp. Root495]
MVTADVSARLAWPDDAAAITRLQIASWREAYGEVVPDGVEELDPEVLLERWALLLERPPDARVRALVGLEHATVRGFVLVHPSADADADPVTDGEVGELVVDAAHRGVGHGSRLLQAAIDTLRADGFTRVRWWVGSTDDALRGFVTATGWEPDGAHRELADESGEARLKQVRLHTTIG